MTSSVVNPSFAFPFDCLMFDSSNKPSKSLLFVSPFFIAFSLFPIISHRILWISRLISLILLLFLVGKNLHMFDSFIRNKLLISTAYFCSSFYLCLNMDLEIKNVGVQNIIELGKVVSVSLLVLEIVSGHFLKRWIRTNKIFLCRNLLA